MYGSSSFHKVTRNLERASPVRTGRHRPRLTGKLPDRLARLKLIPKRRRGAARRVRSDYGWTLAILLLALAAAYYLHSYLHSF
jgi:hypothetical protein